MRRQRSPRPSVSDGTVVEPDPVPDPIRRRAPADRHVPAGRAMRRLAPLAAGAAAMIVATAITTTVGAEESPAAPELNAALLDGPAGTSYAPSAPSPAAAMPPTVAPAPASTSTSTSKKKAAPGPTRHKAPAGTAAKPKSGSAGSGGGAGGSGGSTGGGSTAAGANGWQLVDSDDFTNGMSSKWGKYDGPGHDGNGRRSSGAISVSDGIMTIRGDSNGTTGGMAWADSKKYGKYEVRARFPKGDMQYHPVLLLWPSEVPYPAGGQVNFAETHSAAPNVYFFLHYGSQQKIGEKTLDLGQWHNYAVEWTPGAMRGYIDGEKFFESTDPGTLPPGAMFLTIQLDYFPSGGSPQPTRMDVDWVRLYQ